MNEIIKNIEAAQMKAEAPEFNVGDTVRVHGKIKDPLFVHHADEFMRGRGDRIEQKKKEKKYQYRRTKRFGAGIYQKRNGTPGVRLGVSDCSGPCSCGCSGDFLFPEYQYAGKQYGANLPDR